MKILSIFKTKVIEVIDGDTFKGEVNLGFDIWITRSFLVFGIDTPEIFRPKSDIERVRGVLARDKNILRIALMALNIRVIQAELSRERYTFITLPIYGITSDIPLVLLLFFAAVANSGILEGLIFLYAKFLEGRFKTKRRRA